MGYLGSAFRNDDVLTGWQARLRGLLRSPLAGPTVRREIIEDTAKRWQPDEDQGLEWEEVAALVSVAHWLRRAAWAFRLTIVNLVAQAALLAVSLRSLAHGRDIVSKWLGIAVAAGGILGLA